VRTADPKRAVFFAEIVLGLRCRRAAAVPVGTEEPSSAMGDHSPDIGAHARPGRAPFRV